MPTFIFYRNRTKIDRLQGADINGLESKIKQHYGSSDTEEGGDEYGHGLMDIGTFISKNECEALNEADDHNLEHALVNGAGYMASDVDEQLIISLTFNQAVKIHSLKLKAPVEHGPKNIKVGLFHLKRIKFLIFMNFFSYSLINQEHSTLI